MTPIPVKDKNIDVDIFRRDVLDWYRAHQRKLPWRTPLGANTKPNPYHVWLSEIMLQQTVVAAVISYFEKFTSLWPSVEALAAASQEDVLKEWAGLGYYARARNLHKCAQVITNDYDGVFPDNEPELKKLPGIGDYTAAAITAIAFGNPANVVDGNIERIMARIFAVTESLPTCKPILKSRAALLSDSRQDCPGDYAQALMDIGAGICNPKSPKCDLCPISNHCEALQLGIAADLPRKVKKVPKPHKQGIVYWVEDENGEIMLIRRNQKEMLGGMVGLPTSNWEISEKKLKTPDFLAKISHKATGLFIKHSFTHFDLTLNIKQAKLKNGTVLPENNHFWMRYSEIEGAGLPTLFKKVVKQMNLNKSLPT